MEMGGDETFRPRILWFTSVYSCLHSTLAAFSRWIMPSSTTRTPWTMRRPRFEGVTGSRGLLGVLPNSGHGVNEGGPGAICQGVSRWGPRLPLCWPKALYHQGYGLLNRYKLRILIHFDLKFYILCCFLLILMDFRSLEHRLMTSVGSLMWLCGRLVRS